MEEKQTTLVLDWLQEIIDNPEDWKMYYSDSEVKTLAEWALEIIRRSEMKQMEQSIANVR